MITRSQALISAFHNATLTCADKRAAGPLLKLKLATSVRSETLGSLWLRVNPSARTHTHTHTHTETHTHTHTHTHTQLTANLNSTRSRHTIARTYLLARAGNAPAADVHSDVSPRPKRSSSGGSIYLITPASRRIAFAAGSLEHNDGAGVQTRSFHIDSGRLKIKTRHQHIRCSSALGIERWSSAVRMRHSQRPQCTGA